MIGSEESVALKDEKGEMIDAREVHGFLEVGSKFNDWITNRIKKYGFVAEKDFTVVLTKAVTERNTFYISLDMAKVLLLSENNERGAEAKSLLVRNSILTIDELYATIIDIDIPQKDYKLYAIVDESGRFKVGVSADPERRVKELNIGNAEKLKLVHVMDSERAFQHEQLLHKRLEKHHIRGEWFSKIDEITE